MKKIATICLAFSFAWLSAIEPVSSDLIPQLSVRGEAVLYKPADQMRISIGVVTQDKQSEEALKQNAVKMNRLIEQFEALGLQEEEFQTSQLYIQPIYELPPREIPPHWQAGISHYEAVSLLSVKTQKLDLAGNLIAAAAKAGANKIEDIQFDLKDPRQYRAEAIQAATKNAISDAEALAQAAHIQLRGIQSIVLDQAQEHTPIPYQRTAFYSAQAAGKEFSDGTPIKAGLIEVKALVDMTFTIGPQRTR